MKLKDKLSYAERDELKNVMKNEPVFAGDTISHHTANALKEMGLIERNKDNKWIAKWDAIKQWRDRDGMT